nr:peptidoglycan-binding protein [Candidatus Electrothrix aestuarii]
MWSEKLSEIDFAQKNDSRNYRELKIPQTAKKISEWGDCSKGVNKYGQCNYDESEKVTINQQVFPNAEAGYAVWAGSRYADHPDGPWYVDFFYGESFIKGRTNYYPVRLVRDGQVEDAMIIKEIQKALMSYGFNPGPVDGNYSKQTEQALRAFQRAAGLPEGGGMTIETREALGFY